MLPGNLPLSTSYFHCKLLNEIMDTAIRSFTVKKFYPTVEECKINNLVKCTEDGCSNVFTSESNLMLHLIKTHKKIQLQELSLTPKQYYCPELACMYNKNNFFKNMKCLRQHYMKVHSAKNFKCTLCKKSFSTKNILNNHIEYCGINFECCECHMSYSCYETLKTHGRRKKHKIMFKSEYKSKVAISEDVVTCNKNRLILPKQCISLVVLPGINKSRMNRKIQTEDEKPKLRSKMTQVNKNAIVIPQNTQQTQTGIKHNLFTVETQTIGDFVNVCRKQFDMLNETNVQKTSITQTDTVESRNTSCNTSFYLDNFELSQAETEKNSFGTQTPHIHCSNIDSTSTATHDSIHTDTSDLLAETLNTNMNNFEFFNCNMETQTDFMLNDELFNYDYYMSNMYTQTCDEILNDLGFNDIQTQTVLDDVLRSVESQTMVTHKRKNICKDTSHMETQTDMEYLNMLEVINS